MYDSYTQQNTHVVVRGFDTVLTRWSVCSIVNSGEWEEHSDYKIVFFFADGKSVQTFKCRNDQCSDDVKSIFALMVAMDNFLMKSYELFVL